MGSYDEPKATTRRRWIALSCTLVVLIGVAVFSRGWYSGYRAWHSQAAPLCGDIEPADGTAVYASDAWIHWSSPVAAKGRILWRKTGGPRVNSADAGSGEDLLAHLGSLLSGG